MTAVLVVALYFFGGYISDINARLFGTQEDVVLDHTEVVSNRNGILMAQNVARINEIFKEAENKLEKEQKLSIASYIEEIKTMDLSIEYEDLKKLSRKKLTLLSEYESIREKAKEGKKPYEELIAQLQEVKERYDEIEINTLLMEAFAQAGVEYSVNDDGSVAYAYYKE